VCAHFASREAPDETPQRKKQAEVKRNMMRHPAAFCKSIPGHSNIAHGGAASFGPVATVQIAARPSPSHASQSFLKPVVKQSGRITHSSGDCKPMREPTPRKPIYRIRRLRRAELPVDTVELARYLIGKTLVHELRTGRKGERLSGRIVETEAYPVGDPAGHAFRGLTAATRSLFLARGHAYVRFTYGSCWLMNVTSETPGIGGGVLIRALEPLDGTDRMKRHRGISRLLDLARGPGRLAAAMGIDKRFDGLDLCSRASPLWIGTAVRPAGPIGVSSRIGISRATHRRLRFYERGSTFVSGPHRLRV
jgi:DNA-3-methyladenine glycosylase